MDTESSMENMANMCTIPKAADWDEATDTATLAGRRISNRDRGGNNKYQGGVLDYGN